MQEYLKSRKDSLELELPLTDRKYWKDPNFGALRKIYLQYNSVVEAFMGKPGRSLVNLKYLSLGMDVDLSYGRSLVPNSQYYHLKYLNNFRFEKNFWNKQSFIDLKLEDLLSDWQRLQGLEKELLFFLPSKLIHADVLDNPLKVLDFIKDIHNPKYKVSSDFVL